MASDEKIDEKIIDSKHRADAVVRRITRIRWRGSGGVIHHRKTSAAGNHREAQNGSIGFASRRAAVARPARSDGICQRSHRFVAEGNGAPGDWPPRASTSFAGHGELLQLRSIRR